jgi:hypothetical protein
MALVSEIERSHKDRQSVHRPTRCVSYVVEGPGDQRVVQLDTVGTTDREFTDKVSQSIQFDRQAAEQLIAIFRDTFPGVVS